MIAKVPGSPDEVPLASWKSMTKRAVICHGSSMTDQETVVDSRGE